MLPSTLSISLTLSLLPLTTTAFKLSLYRGESCRNELLSQWVGGPEQGCISGTDAAAGVGSSAVITSTGDADKNLYTVFFSSDDCDPETEMGHKDDGCFDGNYGSFAVWDVGS